jgi:hypothetical protein
MNTYWRLLHKLWVSINAFAPKTWRGAWVSNVIRLRVEWEIWNTTGISRNLALISADILYKDAMLLIDKTIETLFKLDKLWEDYRFLLKAFREDFKKSSRLFQMKTKHPQFANQGYVVLFSEWLIYIEKELNKLPPDEKELNKLPDDIDLIWILNTLKKDITSLINNSRNTLNWRKGSMESPSENKSN